MDEVLQKLSGTLISEEPAEEDKSNFEGLYKNWGKLGNQEDRRREILEVQKKYVRYVYIVGIFNSYSFNIVFIGRLRI